jgi:TolB protein
MSHLNKALLLLSALSLSLRAEPSKLGLFEETRDIGRPAKAGSTQFDPRTDSYLIGGGGENMWGTNDSFQFVYKKLSGNFTLSSAIEWIAARGNPHRKACLIVRQTLDADSPYVDVAVHGDGLISLQFRETPGGPTREIQANQKHQRFAGLNRQGEVLFLSLPPDGESRSSAAAGLAPAGPSTRLALQDPVYVGLAVCAHDDKVIEQARFSQVNLALGQPESKGKPTLHCTLEAISIASKDRRAIYHTTNHIEAPNWSRDGSFFLFNGGGRIHRLPIAGGTPEAIETGFAQRCNNDHGLSPDGSVLVISDQSRGGKSSIYAVPIDGGTPVPITQRTPSYWHGWSPDGATLAYCAERNGEFDIYTIPASGGTEQRLTTAKGLDDGPDYSPDGKFIYFNSERSGTMQIWRMQPDGSHQEQVTNDRFNNWFPHPSPDGKWLVFLSYEEGVSGHPANQRVWLRLLPVNGGPIQELARLFGGQGTINVPSWAPDSRQLAFVSYEFLYP